jgi:hypothetical protein
MGNPDATETTCRELADVHGVVVFAYTPKLPIAGEVRPIVGSALAAHLASYFITKKAGVVPG